MFSLISNPLPLALRSPRVLLAAGLGVAAAAGIAGYLLTRPKPTPEELERERRDLLARTGRITDGTILDTRMDTLLDPDLDTSLDTTLDTTLDLAFQDAAENRPYSPPATILDGESSTPGPGRLQPPHLILYNYRIAGVSYECAQDVTMLADHVHGIRTDLPIQVRYEPHNPGNSIVVAESWSGLRLTPHPSDKTTGPATDRLE